MTFTHSFIGYRPPARFDGDPWTHVRIEESDREIGPYAEVETLPLSPVDTNPTQPAKRNVTTDNATFESGWFRLVFVDAGGQESPASDPVVSPAEDAPSDAFAIWQDLEVRLGETFSGDEQTRATSLLGLASDVIRRAARQTIDVDSSSITVKATGRVLLPQRPVISIDSVTVNGNSVEWELDGDYLSGPWVGQTVEVTYTHGFDPVPDAIKAVCVEVVTRVWVNAGNAAQEAYGSERVSHGSSIGLMLTSEERRTVRDVVRRGSQAVDIR